MSSMSNSHRLRGENEETGHYWVRLPDVYDAQDSPYCMYVECARCEMMLCDNGCHDYLVNMRCENAWALVDEGLKEITVDREVKYQWYTVYHGYFPSSDWWPVG